MTTFAHGLLRIIPDRHSWQVFGRDEDMDDELLERDAPEMREWQTALAAIGSRGWELVSVTDDPDSGRTRMWFKRASDWRSHVPDVVDLV